MSKQGLLKLDALNLMHQSSKDDCACSCRFAFLHARSLQVSPRQQEVCCGLKVMRGQWTGRAQDISAGMAPE